MTRVHRRAGRCDTGYLVRMDNGADRPSSAAQNGAGGRQGDFGANAEIAQRTLRARVPRATDPSRASATALSGPVGGRVLRHRGELRRALRRRGIVDAKIFGSATRGDDRPDSDLDLLVSVPAGLGVLALAGLERELAEILGAPVDLIPEEGLKEHVRRAVEPDLLPL
ncbi:nucleotidyltransferase domain-containing protein [Rathayibacter sp. PhB179]|uniref:nucleotidyltransferase family protein n=1 Tax=unclassified Rathayibacter TaxID=2609250 RepID=UPI003260ED83